jgi:hypothetical protein
MKFGDFIFCTHDMCVWLLVAPRLGVNRHPTWYHGKKSQNPFKLFLNSKKISHALDYSGILWVQIWHVFGLHMATTKRPDSKRWWYQPTWVLDMGAGSPWPFTQCKPIATALTGLELVNFAAQPQHVASPLLSSPLLSWYFTCWEASSHTDISFNLCSQLRSIVLWPIYDIILDYTLGWWRQGTTLLLPPHSTRGPVPLCFVNCYNNIQFNRIWVLLGLLTTKARISCLDSL